MLTNFYYFSYRAHSFSSRHRTLAAFVMVLLFVLTLDIVFHEYLFEGYQSLAFGDSTVLEEIRMVDMGFTPEVWLALLSMVLGTLIIVISIASQSIPKLIDLYMEDWASLLYVWFLIISGAHAAFIKLYGEVELHRESSRVFNIHFLLTLSIIFAFPYIFYILKYTKPSNVINKIFQSNLKRINSLTQNRYKHILTIPQVVEEIQFSLFESINQLDGLLEYVSFKEPKADIIQNMSFTIQEYIKLKKRINKTFFQVSPRVRSDISFKTMIGQFGDMEKSHTFYEQKCFRILGNVYIKLLEEGQFELSSLCVAEMTAVGQTAIAIGDDQLVDALIIRFNTILRFGIKHGVKNNEPRNLYNAAFHYGRFIGTLVEHKKVEHVKQCSNYLVNYGREIFKHGKQSGALYFIVDVFTAEMKKTMIQIFDNEWDIEIQETLLSGMLQVDNPPDFNKEDLDRGTLINNGVRVLQMGLALFYMREEQHQFVKKIIIDLLDDLEVLGETTFRRVMIATCNRLQFSGPTFWEDTDRGNLNIFYTSDQNQIEGFKAKIFESMREKLHKEAVIRFQLDLDEGELLGKLSKKLEETELREILENPEEFENRMVQMNGIDEQTLKTLARLRQKLGMTSNNPDLVVTHTRQIALNTELRAIYTNPRLGQSVKASVKVVHSFLNYFYIKIDVEKENALHWESLKQIVFQFKSPRHKVTYQFETQIEGPPMRNGLRKVVHVGGVHVVL